MPVHTIDMRGGGAGDQWGEAASALAKAFTPDYAAMADGKVRAAQAANSYAGAEASRARAGQYNAAAALDADKLASLKAFSEAVKDLPADEQAQLLFEYGPRMGVTGASINSMVGAFANADLDLGSDALEQMRGTTFDETREGVEAGWDHDRQTALETEWAKPIVTDGSIIGGTGDTRFDQYPGGVAPFGNEVTGGNTIFRPTYGEDGTYTGVDPYTAPKPEAPRGASDLFNYQHRDADGNMVEGLGTLNSAGAPIDSVTGARLPPNVRRIANTAPSAPDTFNYVWTGEDGTEHQELALMDPVTDRIVNTRGEELPLGGRRIGNTEADSDTPKIGDYKNYTYIDEAGDQQVTPATINAAGDLVDSRGAALPINGQFFGTTVQSESADGLTELTATQTRNVDLGGAYLRGLEGFNKMVGFDSATGEFVDGGRFPDGNMVWGAFAEQLMANVAGDEVGAWAGRSVRDDFNNEYDYRGFSLIEPLLRLRSGAATPEMEVRRYKKYLPQPGDPVHIARAKVLELNKLGRAMRMAAEAQGMDMTELAGLVPDEPGAPMDPKVAMFNAKVDEIMGYEETGAADAGGGVAPPVADETITLIRDENGNLVRKE